MSKLLLLILLAVAAYLIVKAVLRKRPGRRDEATTPLPEQMVACAQCGVNLPRSEAIESRNRYFCSEEHRRIAAG